MRIFVVSVLAVVLSACGGSNPTPGANTPCTMTLTGAVSQSNTTCTVSAGYKSGTTEGAIAFTATAASGYQVIVGADFAHDVTTGTYANTDTAVTSGAATVIATTNNYEWEAAKGSTADQGTFTFNITGVETVATQNGDAVYTIHGSVNATMPALPQSAATGTVTLQATF